MTYLTLLGKAMSVIAVSRDDQMCCPTIDMC